jgi:hypothetical protein
MFTRKQYERWSEEDDRVLRTMSEAGKSLTLITVKLNKKHSSMQASPDSLQSSPRAGKLADQRCYS